ncbi:cytochrome c-type biogenesis protein [Rhizobium sp. LjRoot258]|uniref:cytochrome c-type biogenesis protein n=1 Tax=Rhizobium sp. LjRoot258 TaxID=3342299 RepID=UPI003ECD767A
MTLRIGLLLALVVTAATPAIAVNPDEMVADAAREARARTISAEVRCMVCQNQSIDDSNAALAKDLRLLVRERITIGDSDEEVLAYLVDRYGEFVLLKPRVNGHTLLLWMSPVLLVLSAVATLVWMSLRRNGPPPPALSEDELAKLDDIVL